MDGITIDFNSLDIAQFLPVTNRILKLESAKNVEGLREIADLLVAAKKEGFENWEGKFIADHCDEVVGYCRSTAKVIESEIQGDPTPPVRIKSKPMEHPYIALEKASLLEVLEDACCVLLDCKQVGKSYNDIQKLINHVKGIK